MSNGEEAPLVPKLRFPEFQNAAEWEHRRIGDFLRESRLPGSKGNMAKKLTVKLWGNGVFGKKESIQGSINTQYFRRKAGQLIYSKLDFLNQAFGVIPPDLDGFESTVDLPCFDIVGRLNPLFLLEYVKRKEFYERLGETADGSRKARRIHAETFQSFSLLVPLPAEQQKIADCVSSLDELIAAQARKVDALKTHRKGLIQQIFPRQGETQPLLRFPELKRAPDWEQTSLSDLAEFYSGSTPSKANPEFWSGSIPWVSAKDMKTLFLEDAEDHISKAAVKNGARLVPAGTLLLLTRGMTLLKDIPVCLLQCEMSFNQDVKALCRKTNVDARFLALLLVSNKQSLLEMVDIAGHGTGKLNTDELKAFELMLPSLMEQQRIAEFLISFDALITTVTQQFKALEIHKKALIQQLFPSAKAVEA